MKTYIYWKTVIGINEVKDFDLPKTLSSNESNRFGNWSNDIL